MGFKPWSARGALRSQLMSRITLEIPDESLEALKVPDSEAGSTLRLAAAVKLFEVGRLSSGAAARFAGIPKVAFLSRLAEFGVDTFSLTLEDFRKETRLVSNAFQ